MEYRRINYDDDFVVVMVGSQEIYKGIEDYEPMKDEPWKWDEKEKAYFLTENGKTYKKICID